MHYSLALNKYGRNETELEEIFESIRIILLTRKGEKIHDPDFGCAVWDYIDGSFARIPFIVRDVTLALKKYEPRITVLAVTPELDTDFLGKIDVLIDFQMRANSSTHTVLLNFNSEHIS